MKVKFTGQGTQFHPRLGKLEKGKAYDLPEGAYPEVFFEPVGDDEKADGGPASGGPAEITSAAETASTADMKIQDEVPSGDFSGTQKGVHR